MFGGSLKLVIHFTSLLILVQFQFARCDDLDRACAPSSCGSIANISYPFRLKDDPQHCGIQDYELSCHHNVTILYAYAGTYYVHEIDYKNYTIRIVDSGLKSDNCSSLPSQSLGPRNFIQGYPYATYQYMPPENYKQGVYLSKKFIFVSCAKRVNSSNYVDATHCLNGSMSGSNSSTYRYVMVGRYSLLEMESGCRVELMGMVSDYVDDKNASYEVVHRQLVRGFDLSWIYVLCNCSYTSCEFDQNLQPRCLTSTSAQAGFLALLAGITSAVIILGGRFCLCGVPLFALLLICRWRKRHSSSFQWIEDFLSLNNNLMPLRYTFSDIKTVTKNFKDKLGEGGFASVYKARLRSGRIVAVKVLSTAKGNGQDFINEVGTIGRIHHVNVVKLIGYCAERSRRALVYEFMPNGSLEKYIFGKGENVTLSCRQMYEIAVGVARGIEYLHRGCDMQILHFDIKPHNILLDEHFTPKVSDFGLARLCPTGKDNVTLTVVRGTMGYMAPELFYKNIGGVSYKADVYSFGMLLMEMAGRRKNMNALVERASQVYFPSWIYEQLVANREMGAVLGEGMVEEEVKMVKKMVIAGLWCIQMKPEDRPSMNRVVEMLEGEVEGLELPVMNPADDSRLDSLSRGNAQEIEADYECSSSSIVSTN